MQLLEALNYMGPNRRFDCTAIEMLIEFAPQEKQALIRHMREAPTRLKQVLVQSGVEIPENYPEPAQGNAEIDAFGSLFCQTCILLQRHAGHEVDSWRVIAASQDMQRRFVYQHEERGTAEKAGDIALLILAQLIPGLEWQSRTDETEPDAARLIERFTALAEPLAMPRDTLDIIAAAQRLDIPCVKLERDPYQPLPGPHRIRDNSLLMLGHSRFRQIVDGTVCVTRSQALLPHSATRQSRMSLLRSIGIKTSDVSSGQIGQCALLAGQQFIGLADAGEPLPRGVVEQLERFSASLPCGMLMFSFEIDSDGKSVRIQDFDIAPRIDTFPAITGQMRREATEAFLRWVYPPGERCRIPVISITGTNGKSTTTTMIDYVMRDAGLKTGVAYSSGVQINGKTTEQGDLAGLMGHYRVFESPEPEIALLETARGGVAQRGFAFDWSNIGVCLNVEDDHIGLLGIDSVEQMAEIKRSIVARARDAVVLNADNEHCREMVSHMNASRLCLVSTHSGINDLRTKNPDVHDYCVLEKQKTDEWIIFYTATSRLPVVRVADIPATDSGHLKHNIINAAHAVASCVIHGLPVETVGSALQSFRLDAQTLLGRWNVLEGLPFKVIFDYAHNAHGIRHMVDALSHQPITGTRRVAFAFTADRGEQSIQDAMSILKTGFDQFLVTEFMGNRGVKRGKTRERVRTALLHAGVAQSDISLFDNEDLAVKAGLETSDTGDLLVVLAGKKSMHRIWQLMCDFRDKNRSPD